VYDTVRKAGAWTTDNPYLHHHNIRTPSEYEPTLRAQDDGSALPAGFRAGRYTRWFSAQLNGTKLDRDTSAWIQRSFGADPHKLFTALFRDSASDALQAQYLMKAFEAALTSIAPGFFETYKSKAPPGVRRRGQSTEDAFAGGTTGAGLIRLPNDGGYLLFVLGDAGAIRVEGERRYRYGAFADKKESSQLAPGHFAGLTLFDRVSKPESSIPSRAAVHYLSREEVSRSILTFITDGFGTAASFEQHVGSDLSDPRRVLARARVLSEQLSATEKIPDDRTMLSVDGREVTFVRE